MDLGSSEGSSRASPRREMDEAAPFQSRPAALFCTSSTSGWSSCSSNEMSLAVCARLDRLRSARSLLDSGAGGEAEHVGPVPRPSPRSEG